MNRKSLVENLDLFSTNANVYQVADQPTRDRIRIRSHFDGAAFANANACHRVVGIEPSIRQRRQRRQVLGESIGTHDIQCGNQLFNELDIGITRWKVARATQ
ncbi:MAG: hypothetical protein V3W41_01810 [Planctomycetota bacterium]